MTTSATTFAIVLMASISLLSIGIAPDTAVHPGRPILLVHDSVSVSPYLQTFRISANSSDYSPYLVSPASNKTVWVVAVKTRNLLPPLSQILNYTIGSKPTAVLAQPLANVPSAILFNQTHGKARVWLVENDSLAYYDPVARNMSIAYAFPPGSSPESFMIDNLGRIWLTLLGGNKIAMYDPAQPTAKYFNIPSPESEPVGIALAPDQSVWFTEANGSRIAHLILDGQENYRVIDYRPPPTVHILFPIQIAVEQNGIVWFTDHGTNQFGSVNPATNEWRVMPIGYCSQRYNPDCAVGLPNAMSFDGNGKLWFSEHFAGRIARYDPSDGLLTEYTVPASSPPYTWWMQPGPGNLVWFTAFGTGEIGYVNASVPVPISLNATNTINLQQGTTQTLPATILTPQNSVSLNVSANDIDSPPGSAALLSGRPSQGQIGPSPSTITVTFSITAAWNLPSGNRTIALTAYNSNVDVNTFVTVHVTAHLLLVQTFAPFLGLGLAASSVAGGTFLYWRHSRKLEDDKEDGAGLD